MRGAIAILLIAMILVVGVATQGRETLAQIRLEPRHMPLLLFGWIVVAWTPILWVFGRVTGWRRLAGRYPATPARIGRRKGHPMIRLTLAADPGLRILIPVPVGEGLVALKPNVHGRS